VSLKFGTDGWRAVIAEEFTFRNVRRVCAAIEKTMAGAGRAGGKAIIGHDTRFLSRRFAEAAAETLAAAGRHVMITDRYCPTPAASCKVVEEGAAYAVVITASHNPAIFNGVKIKDSTGASAGEEITSACEKLIAADEPARLPLDEAARRGLFEIGSFREAHRVWIEKVVDLDTIRDAGLSVVVDPMHGACGEIMASLLAGGSTRVRTLRAAPDPLFGGAHPEPLERHLAGLKAEVPASGADVGLATDGDGDRIGAFDEKGNFVSPLLIAPLIARNFLKRGRTGPLGKTFANTILLDRIAARHGLPFSVFPVGFKHIARQMVSGRLLLAGEESGGIGIEGFVPERDGTLIGLLVLQAMIDEGKPLSSIIADMQADYGQLHYERRDLPCPSEKGRALVEDLKKRRLPTIGGMKVTGLDDLDGLKFLFGEDGWILFRASGTEPILRIYSEAPSAERLAAIMGDAMEMVAAFTP